MTFETKPLQTTPMFRRSGPVKWREDMGEERLWVCISCGAELDTECVGETCPSCGVEIEDENNAE